MHPQPREADPQALRSALHLRFFENVLTRRLCRSFHAVRLAKPGVPRIASNLPLIVYCNHPSWWDGALVPILVARAFRSRRAFGPIDADALARYGFMRRLGFFGVQPGSYGGAATFLRVGRSVLSKPDTVFCITPQGEFVDVRNRPVRMQPGLAGLIANVARVIVLPLAVEYPFWSESAPEALARFGEPQVMGRELPDTLVETSQKLRTQLTAAMDRLAEDAASREPDRFVTLLQGSSGVGGIYDAWRRVNAWRRGERFDPSHIPSSTPPPARDHG